MEDLRGACGVGTSGVAGASPGGGQAPTSGGPGDRGHLQTRPVGDPVGED